MYCRKCGAEMPDSSRYCSRCGEPLLLEGDIDYSEDEEEVEEETEYYYGSPRKQQSFFGCLFRFVFGLIKLVFSLVLVVAILASAIGTVALYRMKLYVYSTCTYNVSEYLSKQDKEELESMFTGYMFVHDNIYSVIDPDSGLGFDYTPEYLNDINQAGMDEGLSLEFEEGGGFIYCTLSERSNPDERIIVSYRQPSFSERLRFGMLFVNAFIDEIRV